MSVEAVRERALCLLGHPDSTAQPPWGGSGLNADATPLQLCLSLRADGVSVRLVADPCSEVAEPALRYARAQASLRSTLELAGSQELAPVAQRLLEYWGPSQEVPVDAFSLGVFWLAAATTGPGVAVYMDTSAHAASGNWERARRWLSAELGEGREACRLLSLLSGSAWASSAGIEGSRLANVRLKVYARFHPGFTGGDLGPHLPFAASPGVHEALAAIMGCRGVSHDGLLLGLGFRRSTGVLADAKLDVSGAELGLEPAALGEAVDRCCHSLGLRPLPLTSLMLRNRLTASFIGIGTTTEQVHRLNVYLKPSHD